MPKLRINNFRLDSSEDSEGELDIAVGHLGGEGLEPLDAAFQECDWVCRRVQEQHGHQDLVLKLSGQLSNLFEGVEGQHLRKEPKELSFG